ncbi:DNA primase [Niabella drilacis]|uniref:DNA primase n=1 Tax=Niabella drilacis (strain DSM 25811 / CCM 8410 / CCUG 62505 / LMG 26954 / E90) TaxID=1285928 RepID=A0A1G6ILT0_NIADE|nr:DNA primase [Niabella drilacis]SDC07381.1 DNA primase [Niabella drilacis]
MISQNTIQEILSRIDILDVVGEFVKLKKRGANYLGVCPFHNEKTPSFTVSPSKEIYKCFGCGKSGNTISFIMEHEKYSYVETLKWLANRYGIEVEETFASAEQREQYQTADSLFIINNFAEQYFSQTLMESEEGRAIGLSYFKERGFREAIIKKFRLGYAPADRSAFAREALAKQYNKELLLKTGLVIERNGTLLDNYRGRVIFPVHNHSGKVMGFGARILKTTEKAPKYINTPENEIYVKSKILYGSYFARTAIEKADECLLVEGYTDVVSLHQAGIENVVASGGTSLTVDQLRLIKKYTNNLTIIYDGDAAGIKAALRGLDLALEESLNVKLVLIPDKEDPDSYVNKVGAGAFTEFIKKNKKDFILFQLESSLNDIGDDPVKKSELVNKIAESISRINKAEDFTKQQDYIKESAAILQIDEAGLHALVNKYIRDKVTAMERKAAGNAQKEQQLPEAALSNYDDATFDLLFKDQLQEKELARILLEYGNRKWDENSLIAQHVFDEIDELELEDPEVNTLVASIKQLLRNHPEQLNDKYFIYNEDKKLSAFAVSLLNHPYEESERWAADFSPNTGYQRDLFKQSFEAFARVISKGNETDLNKYKLISEDRTNQKVESAIQYLKLKKIRRMLLQNQNDMSGTLSEHKFKELHFIHKSLKDMEREITNLLGTVILH